MDKLEQEICRKVHLMNKEDRDNIFRVCLAACGRELAKLKE